VLWQDVEALGAQIQHTWLTFARTGIPPPALPWSSAAVGGGCAGGGGDVWRSYDEQTRPTMVFGGGSRSRLVSDPMAIERKSVDAAIGAARRGATLGL
jgi:carboxylesterase type B